MADPHDPPQPPIRRGRGLRLSGSSAANTDALTSADAPEPSQPAATQTTLSEAPPPAPVPAPPLRRGRALRLSQTPLDPAAPANTLAANALAANADSSANALAANADSADEPVATNADAPAPANALAANADAADEPVAAADAVTRWRISTARGPLSYLAVGNGPPLLLLHGWGASARIWATTLPALRERRSCYALDLPGFGESPARSGPPSLAALAADVIAFADTLGLPHFDLLGHDLGAAVAVLVASNQPTRVDQLALLGLGIRRFAPEQLALNVARPSLDLSLGIARPWLSLWEPVSRVALQSPPLAATMAAMLLHHAPTTSPLWPGFLADLAAADPRAYLTMLTASGDPQLHAALPTIRARTLCVAGREDRVTRLAEAEAAHGLIGRSDLVALANCGHMAMIEQPVALAAALRGFF